MFRFTPSAFLCATFAFISCTDSTPSGAEGDSSSSDLLKASSSLQSSANKESSGALSSYASSSEASSSSEKGSSGSNVYWNQAISYGVLTDTRDKKIYRTTLIGKQNWMAENLNFTVKVGESRCYDVKPANCAKYGRLYDWDAAAASCPTGWHLPDTTEWGQLAKLLGGPSAAGKILKASSALWKNNTGNDAFGFAALPSGSYDDDQFYDLGAAGLWWTSSDLNSTTAYYRDIVGGSSALRAGQETKEINLAVRCVEDSKVPGSSAKLTSSSSSIAPISEIGLSSSAAISSSIAALVPPDRNCTYTPVTPTTSPATGILKCPKNETYKTVTIGSAIWMAQSLNYGAIVSGAHSTGNQSNDGVIEKYCSEDDAANCATEGALYQWAEAMNFKFACNATLLTDATCNGVIETPNHQGICPTGWHIANASDWNELVSALGGDIDVVGSKMKLNNTGFSNWDATSLAINDGNSSGFSAYPSGTRVPEAEDGYDFQGSVLSIWGVEEHSDLLANDYFLSPYVASLINNEAAKVQGQSIRCVKNP